MQPITQFIANLSHNFSRKRLVCEVAKTSNILRFLKVLRQLNIIYGYTATRGSKSVFVYLRYSLGRPVIANIATVSRPSARRYVSARRLLQSLQKKPATLVVLSTPLGLNSVYARTGGVPGGEFICKIW